MCERCGVMETAFFAEYNESHRFNAAYAAAIQAATEYDEKQQVENLAPEERIRFEAMVKTAKDAQVVGFGPAINSYVTEYGASLGEEHVGLLEHSYKLMDLAKIVFDNHQQDKVRTVLEVGNNLAQVMVANNAAFFHMVVMATILTEIVACPDARAALDNARRTIPGVTV